MKSLYLSILLCLSYSCQPKIAESFLQEEEPTKIHNSERETVSKLDSKTVKKTVKKDELNILWIVAEDLSSYLPMFGDSTIQTPHLSRLASQGVCYDNLFTPAAVCAPARSAIAMGMYPTHLGSNHMRTGPWYKAGLSQEIKDKYSNEALPNGINAYEAIAPDKARMMSEYLRMKGYYCTNNAKEDYQFVRTATAWDDCSKTGHWRNRPHADQPFFSIFNLNVTHESQIWARAEDSLWVDKNLEVNVPPYLPDNEIGLKDVRQMYSNIKQMDAQVGKIIDELKEDGLLEKTVIFWYSDHGGPLPRQKRLLYDSGIKVPMIIRFPNQEHAQTRNEDLVSFIDLAPTVLSLLGMRPPSHMDGKAFLGKFKRWSPAKYVYAAADRFDESYDSNRAIRDNRYKLIQYLNPEKSMFLHVEYRDQMPIMQELHRMKKEDELTPAQALWFRETKPTYEFFDTKSDPHELNNLIDDPQYVTQITEMKIALLKFQRKLPDQMIQDEKDYISKLWPQGIQPKSKEPQFEKFGNAIKIQNTKEWNSLGFQITLSGENPDPDEWSVYLGPVSTVEGKTIHAIADRVGYLPSGVVSLEM